MAETAKIVLDLDNKEFVRKLKDSMGLLGQMGDAKSFDDIGAAFLKIGKIAGVAAAAIGAMKVVFDASLETEKVDQINRSFDAMAQSIGLVADTIKGELIEATKGLVDDDEAVQSATRAMVALGDQAKLIPEIMNQARKATALFGGELTQNFEAFSSALASGNLRSLKQFGIILDSEKVLKDYAKTLGVGVQFLTESAKKQALANAALEKAKEKYANVDESALKATNAFTRFKVSVGELYEGFARMISQSKLLASTFDLLAKGLDAITPQKPLTMLERYNKEIASAEASISKLNDVIAERKQAADEADASWLKNGDNIRKDVAQLEAQREAYVKLIDQKKAFISASEEEARKKASGQKGDELLKPDAQIDYEELKKNRSNFLRDLSNLDSQSYDLRKKNAMDFEAYEIAHYEQTAAMAMRAAAQVAEIDRLAKENGLQDDQRVADAKLAVYTNLNERLKELDQDMLSARVVVAENQLKNAQTTGDGIRAAFNLSAAQATRDFENFGRRGQVVFKAFEKNAVSSLVALGEGTADAGEAMKGFMFGALADIAEAEGRVMLLQAFHNPAAGAAGAALIVLSGVLRGMAGNKAKSEGVGSSGGSGGGGADSPSASHPEAKDQPRKAVTVQIQGSYFETDQTRTRLMEMIRESGDFTDFNLRQIGG